MQRRKTKWRADPGTRAQKLMDRIHASIERLDNEDLLDLHDIFRTDAESPLENLASQEMQRRNLRG